MRKMMENMRKFNIELLIIVQTELPEVTIAKAGSNKDPDMKDLTEPKGIPVVASKIYDRSHPSIIIKYSYV